MNEGMYHASIALGRGMRAQEVHAENIAHAAIPGYRRSTPLFTAFASHLEEASGRGRDFQYVDQTRVFAQGSIDESKNPYDLALAGPGFFTVQANDGGTLYTRAGNFTVGADGTLQTHDGRAVLGTGGPIVLDPNGDKPRVAGDGTVHQGENPVGQIRVVEFDEPYPLVNQSPLYYRAEDGAIPRETRDTTIRQFYRESSNVNVMEEMIAMMDSFRNFEQAQKVISTINDTLGQLLQRATQ